MNSCTGQSNIEAGAWDELYYKVLANPAAISLASHLSPAYFRYCAIMNDVAEG